MPAYSIATSADDGTDNGVVWTSGGVTMSLTTANSAGLRFTGLPTISIPGLYDQAATIFQSVSLRLTLATADANTLQFFVLNEQDSATFTNLNGPRARPRFSSPVATYAITVAPFLQTVDIPLSLVPELGLSLIHQTAGWAGTLALRIDLATGGTTVLITALDGAPGNGVAPTLITTEVPWETGMSGSEWVGRGVRTDPKTGEHYPADESVRDGYLRRRFVHPDNWDPIDENRVQPRSRGRSRRRVVRPDL